MNLDSIQVFLAAAERGSFTAVAQAEDLDVSSVSRKIAALEEALGFRLFERSTRRIALTEAGAAYRERVAPLIAELSAAGAAARDLVSQPKGTLRVSASTAFGQRVVVPMLPEFRKTYPEVAVHLILADRQVSLIDERIDVAVRLAPDAPADVVVSRLARTRYRVVATRDYWRAHPVEKPGDLGGHSCLLFPYPGFRDRWIFREGDSESAVPVSGHIEISGALALREAALLGLGPALLADWLIGEDLASGRLVDGFPDQDVTATTFDTGAWVLYPSRQYLPLKTRVFIDMMRSRAKVSTTY